MSRLSEVARGGGGLSSASRPVITCGDGPAEEGAARLTWPWSITGIRDVGFGAGAGAGARAGAGAGGDGEAGGGEAGGGEAGDGKVSGDTSATNADASGWSGRKSSTIAA